MAVPTAVLGAIRDRMTATGGRVKRDAFLYLDGFSSGFAQCGTCWLFTGNRCAVLGPSLDVNAEDSCGYYGQGRYDDSIGMRRLFRPEQVGFVRHKVRCENCRFFLAPGTCGLFKALNSTMPSKFDLDARVKPQGCCNAQTPP